MITLNVNSLENAEIFWNELGLENDIALNETTEAPQQNLVLAVQEFQKIYDKVQALGLPFSPMTTSANDKKLFSFVAPEGNLFVVVSK